MDAMELPRHYAKGSSRSLIDHLFETPELRALLYRMSVEWGTPVEMMDMAPVALWSLFFVSVNWRLMVGGTHTLAHAMVMAGVREGMDFYESSEVTKILLEEGRLAYALPMARKSEPGSSLPPTQTFSRPCWAWLEKRT